MHSRDLTTGTCFCMPYRSSYGARMKFGEHNTSVIVTKGNSREQCALQTPWGGGVVRAEYMMGRSIVIFWFDNLHPRNFFGSRDLSRIFLLGLKVCFKQMKIIAV